MTELKNSVAPATLKAMTETERAAYDAARDIGSGEAKTMSGGARMRAALQEYAGGELPPSYRTLLLAAYMVGRREELDYPRAYKLVEAAKTRSQKEAGITPEQKKVYASGKTILSRELAKAKIKNPWADPRAAERAAKRKAGNGREDHAPQGAPQDAPPKASVRSAIQRGASDRDKWAILQRQMEGIVAFLTDPVNSNMGSRSLNRQLLELMQDQAIPAVAAERAKLDAAAKARKESIADPLPKPEPKPEPNAQATGSAEPAKTTRRRKPRASK